MASVDVGKTLISTVFKSVGGPFAFFGFRKQSPAPQLGGTIDLNSQTVTGNTIVTNFERRTGKPIQAGLPRALQNQWNARRDEASAILTDRLRGGSRTLPKGSQYTKLGAVVDTYRGKNVAIINPAMYNQATGAMQLLMSKVNGRKGGKRSARKRRASRSAAATKVKRRRKKASTAKGGRMKAGSAAAKAWGRKMKRLRARR